MIRKLNFVLCILLVLVFVAQTFMMLQPYFTFTPKVSKFDAAQGVVATPTDYNLMQLVWTEWVDSSNMSNFLIDGLEKADLIEGGTAQQKKDQLGELSNSLFMPLVGITVLGAVMAVMTIFTRKSLIHYTFTLCWAACSLWAFLGQNHVLQAMGNENGMNTVLPIMTYLGYAAVALTVLRAYPFIYSRFIYKAPVDLEALNA